MQIRETIRKLSLPRFLLPFIPRAAGFAGPTARATPTGAALKRTALVIADISGYTGFLQFHQTSLLHASQIVTDLLDTVIEKSTHPLILNKLEGDAVFLYAELGADEAAAARDISRQVQLFFAAFRAKVLGLSGERAACTCEACQRIRSLKLKAILHAGTVAFVKVRQFDELVGGDVVLVHRLLKNSIEAREYLLMTDSFYRLAGDLRGLSGVAQMEHCEGIGLTGVRVFVSP